MSAPGVAESGHASIRELRVLVPFAVVTLIWSSTWLVIRTQNSFVSSTWSVCWRFTLAAAGMAVVALARRESLRPTRPMLAMAVPLGLLQFAMNFQLVYLAEEHLTSGIVAVLYALLMVPNAVLGRIFLGQTLSRGFLAGSAIAIAGIAMMLLHEFRMAPPSAQVGLGLACTLGGLMAASASNVLQAAPRARALPMCALLAWAMALGALADAALALVVSGPPVLPADPRYLGGVAYLALAGSVITFPLYFMLLRTMGAARAAYNGVLVPVLAMVLSTGFEGYRWSPLTGAGAALAMAGLVVALRARNPSR